MSKRKTWHEIEQDRISHHGECTGSGSAVSLSACRLVGEYGVQVADCPACGAETGTANTATDADWKAGRDSQVISQHSPGPSAWAAQGFNGQPA